MGVSFGRSLPEIWKMKRNGSRVENVLALVCGGCVILIIILVMHWDYPFVGHDYAYFIPHLIDTALHIRINGLTIQWYTPSFGGGLPAFPNPQHAEYSIVQLLSLWLDPWSAVLLSTAGIALVGYYFFYKFLNEHLELDWRASTLGAMFFIGNGFYIEHLIAGQMGYQLFPLFGVILYTLTKLRNHFLYASTIIAVIFSMMIHQAGFYLIVILLLSLSMTLPILFLYRPKLIDLKNLGWTAALTFVLTMALTASKVFATIAFMRHYPRNVFDVYDVGWFQALIGIAGQLLGVMNLGPVLSAAQYNPEIITGILSNLTGAKYGIWETDTGLSPVLIFFLVSALANIILRIRRNPAIKLARSQLLALVLLSVAVWITFEFATARGIIYSITKQMPGLKSLHINIRFVAAFITPLVISGVFQSHVFFLRRQRWIYFLVGAFLTSISLFSYFSLSDVIHIRRYDAGVARTTYQRVRSEEIILVKSIADIDVWKGFSEDASSIKPYEPIFGYKLEEFKPQIQLGSVFEEDNGYFNMTNPESFVFPELNDLHPFERFKVSERDKLETFLKRRQPEWNLPTTQKILNRVSLIAAIVGAGILFGAQIARIATTLKRKSVI